MPKPYYSTGACKCGLRTCEAEAVKMSTDGGSAVLWCATGHVTVIHATNHQPKEVYDFNEDPI